MMDKSKTLAEYRQKHPSCYYCIWYRFFSRCMGEFCFDECKLKDKVIHFPKLKAKVCKWYQVKEEKVDE